MGHICGVILIFPVLASLIYVQNGLFEVLCAIHSAGEDLVRAEARQEGLNIVHIALDLGSILYFVILKKVDLGCP